MSLPVCQINKDVFNCDDNALIQVSELDRFDIVQLDYPTAKLRKLIRLVTEYHQDPRKRVQILDNTFGKICYWGWRGQP